MLSCMSLDRDRTFLVKRALGGQDLGINSN